MLLDLRDRVKNSRWLGIIIVAIISIPFVFVGIGGYLSGGGDDYAVKINGEEVSMRFYEQQYHADRQQLQSMYGGKLPKSLDIVPIIRKRTLETIINETLLNQHAEEFGFIIDDAAVSAAIYAESSFQENGEFDKALYEKALQSKGMTAKTFEQFLRKNLATRQFRDRLSKSSFETNIERALTNTLHSQIRSFSLIRFNADSLTDGPPPDDQAVHDYFSENAHEFMHPEAVKLQYVELNHEKLWEQIEVDQESLRAFYEEEKANYMVPQQRRASHILISSSADDSNDESKRKRQQLLDIRNRIVQGESFEDLAKEFSEDPGSAEQGGDMGEFPRGVMVPEFDNAAFTLEKGELSDIVESSYGFHLIKVTDIIPEHGQSFEQARAGVEDAYKTREAETLFLELSDILANEAYENSDSLDSAAAAIGVDVIETDYLAANSGADILQYSSVQDEAFDTSLRDEGVNSEIIEILENHIVVLRIQDYRNAKPKSLDEVHEEIVLTLTQRYREEKIEQAAKDAQSALQSGESPANVAARFEGGELVEERSSDRHNSDIDANILNTLFGMPRPVNDEFSYSTVKTASGDQAVVILSAVLQPGEEKESNEETEESQVITQYSATTGNSEYKAWLASLRARADIVVNKELSENVSNQ